jgi:MarR family transcriptional regulator, transcriptional regulator for hemolysin
MEPYNSVNMHELDAPPWLRVETTLMATARLVRDAYDRRLAPLDLSLTQALVLAYVSDFGPVTQTKIADHLGQGRAATGVTVDGLQDRRLVKRRPDPDDRRVWLIDMTATGRVLVGEITSVDEKLRTELRAGISRAERQALARVLTRLRANLVGVVASSSDPSRPNTIRRSK